MAGTTRRRYREPVWKGMVENFLDTRKDDIQKLLKEYNIPQVLSDGSVSIGDEKFVRNSL